MEGVGEVLLTFLVLSAVFEVALTPLFNWRIFLRHFEGKGWKTPITVFMAYVVFWGYGMDIVYDLLTALGYEVSRGFGGQLLTALLIAGGSSGIFQIFRTLKIREDEDSRRTRTAEARGELPQ